MIPFPACSFDKGSAPAPINISPNYNNGLPKVEQPFVWEFTLTDTATGTGLASSMSWTCRLYGKGEMGYITRDSTVVDKAVVKKEGEWFENSGPAPISGGFEVKDPRLNHDPAEWTRLTSHSLGAINNQALLESYFSDAGKSMYCRNGWMKSPAELGYISVGKPWRTVDLLNLNSRDFVAYLETDTNILAWTRGGVGVFYTNATINPNTDNPYVCRAALVDLQYTEVPHDTGPTNTLTIDDVKKIQQKAFEFTANKTRTNAFQGVGSWGVALDKIVLPLRNKNERESILRNTWGLFNPHSGLFTVLVIAQTIQDNETLGNFNLEEDVITGERRAVALVWHDPYSEDLKKNGGRQEFFIRAFKYLEEED
jgi:hypothetical protein